MRSFFASLSQQQERWAWLVFGILMACLFGALTASRVFEYDIFWQIRAGQEIFQTWKVQTTDSWSFTAYGQPWYNFQWLACLVSYWASLLTQDYAAICYMRVLLVAIAFGVLTTIIRHVQLNKKMAWGAALILLPWIHRVVLHRIQMRPDLFATVLFTFLMLVSLSKWSLVKKRTYSILLLFLWANFHNGTLPFGIVFLMAEIVTSPFGRNYESLLSKIGWGLATCFTLIATPVGVNVFPAMIQLAVKYDPSKTGNLDQQPYTWGLLRQWMFGLWPVNAGESRMLPK